MPCAGTVGHCDVCQHSLGINCTRCNVGYFKATGEVCVTPKPTCSAGTYLTRTPTRHRPIMCQPCELWYMRVCHR